MRFISRWIILIAALVVFIFISKPSEERFLNAVAAPALLVTAHPDDEVMFFSPTVLSLVSHHLELHVLCLSVGDSDGLGSTRKVEFIRSLAALGVPSSNSHILDVPELKDNFTLFWDAKAINKAVDRVVKRNNIRTVLTFDDYGVSGHPNHGSIPAGVAVLQSRKPTRPLKVYTLVSRHRLIKFTGPLLWPIHVIKSMRQSYPYTTSITWKGYIQALNAMRQHRSQLVWFRYLYLVFSRYMIINEWIELESPAEKTMRIE